MADSVDPILMVALKRIEALRDAVAELAAPLGNGNRVLEALDRRFAEAAIGVTLPSDPSVGCQQRLTQRRRENLAQERESLMGQVGMAFDEEQRKELVEKVRKIDEELKAID